MSSANRLPRQEMALKEEKLIQQIKSSLETLTYRSI